MVTGCEIVGRADVGVMVQIPPGQPGMLKLMMSGAASVLAFVIAPLRLQSAEIVGRQVVVTPSEIASTTIGPTVTHVENSEVSSGATARVAVAVTLSPSVVAATTGKNVPPLPLGSVLITMEPRYLAPSPLPSLSQLAFAKKSRL